MTETVHEMTVSEAAPPDRLDVFVARHSTLSRSQTQKYIKRGMIVLNGRPARAHRPVRPGDVIAIRDAGTKFQAQPSLPPQQTPAILFEDDDYLVINKPAGLVVHRAPGVRELTVADWAVGHAPAVADVGDQPRLRPGIVHRLDRDVSGVMVIAKTAAAFDDLKKQFQEHRITKEYLALVHGRLTDPAGRISFAIARKADKSGLMVARPQSHEGKRAETLFAVERIIKNMSLVRVQTLTGRTHQIRVHFKAIGHPLLGDPLYKARKLKTSKIEAPRLFLHAAVLGFTDLDGRPRRFEAPLPAELERWLARLT